jgi:hypothetical protein
MGQYAASLRLIVIAVGKESKVIGCCDVERGAERDRQTDSQELKRNNTRLKGLRVTERIANT